MFFIQQKKVFTKFLNRVYMYINIEIPYAYANKADFSDNYKNAAENLAINGNYNQTRTSYNGVFDSNDPELSLWGASFNDTFASKITLYEILGKIYDQNSDMGTYIFDNTRDPGMPDVIEQYMTHLKILTIEGEDYYQFFVPNIVSGEISFYCYLKIKDLLYSSDSGNDILKLYLSTSATTIEIVNNITNNNTEDIYIWTLKDNLSECSCMAVEKETGSLNTYFIKLALKPLSIDYIGEISILSKDAFYDYKLNSSAYSHSLNWVTYLSSPDEVPLNSVAEMSGSNMGRMKYRLQFTLYATKHADASINT